MRDEKKMWLYGSIVAAMIIPASIAVLIGENSPKNAVYAEAVYADEGFIEQTEEEPEIRQIRGLSGMPCENREQFERWYEEYEQKAVEEMSAEATEEIRLDSDTANQVDSANAEISWRDTSAEEMESEGKASSPIYTIGGELIDPDIQRKLYDALERHNISYWYEGALCQMYQESGGNPTIVNSTNGVDMGLFQYREPFWDYSRGDIFDPEAQIELYAEETAARINAGLTVDEVISRHNTSDYVTEINLEYVGQVKQWLSKMEVIE